MGRQSMRLECLRFANLNALAGSWEIDFTRPEIAGEGVVLMTGPTGAGKTTILDAITLALYGRTPRVGRITETQNEVLTRGEAQMFAEVTFMVRGRRYGAIFSQRRARGQRAGRLQAPRHELFDLQAGRVLASGLRDTERAVVEVLGLDFAQFTRAVLLAQNGFAAFLLAAPDERAPLLERITGTVLYSQLSMAAHLRAKEERERREALEMRLAALALQDPEALARDQQRFVELEEALRRVEGRLQELSSFQQRWAAVRRWEEELHGLEAARGKVLRELAALGPALHEATLAQRAEEVSPLVAEVERLQKEAAEAAMSCKRLAQAMAQAEQERAHLERAEVRAEEQLRASEAELEALRPLLVRAQTLDAQLMAAAALSQQAHASMQEAEQRLAEVHARYTRTCAAKNALLQRLAVWGITDPEQVSSHRSAWEEQEAQSTQALKQARTELEALQAELALVKEIESLEAKRQALRPGAPCPLCGSLEHPFAAKRPQLRPVEAAVAAAHERCAGLAAEVEAIGQRLQELDGIWSQLVPMVAAEHEHARGREEAQQALDKATARWTVAAKEHASLQAQRQEVLGGASPAAVEQRLQQAVAAARQALEVVRQQRAAKAAHVAGLAAQEEAWRQRQAALDEDLAQAKAQMERRLVEVGFASLGVWQAARREQGWIDAVLTQGRETEARLASLEQSMQRASQRLREARQAVAGLPLEESLTLELQAAQAEQRSLLEKRAAVAAALAEGERRQREAERLLHEMAAQAAVSRVWERLRELIGASDGKKLRNFAQGLTLDLLLALANTRLRAMHDRYQLVRDAEGLDIMVLDGYRAGERRSVRNLSGGETFMVSLALALALSALVSRGERLGCLFIDEGFGSLDEESLDLVLDSLFALGQEDRLVGLISHVPALRERLGCQILVRPVAPGRSALWVRQGREWTTLAGGRSVCLGNGSPAS